MSRNWNFAEKKSPAEECVSYFKEQPVLGRMLKGFREKYASYGAFSGTVILRNLKPEEIEILEGFFRKNYHGQKSVSISAGSFRKALGESRFGEISPEEILRLYFDEEIIGKKERKNQEEEQISALFRKVSGEWGSSLSGQWVEEVWEEKPPVYFYLVRKYRDDSGRPAALEDALRFWAKVLRFLPGEKGNAEYLPVFSARMTGNPHFFDEGTPEGRAFYQLVQWYVEKRECCLDQFRIFPTLRKQRVYLAAGILRDDISNYATVSGVRAWKRGGLLHAGMEGFLEEDGTVMVPLSAIVGWEEAECTGNRVYIVENPSVFSILSEKIKGKYACMCMNGQPRLASVLLLDLLGKRRTEVYYAGDFDPEGLLIAQKVKQYYDGPFFYWHMTAEDYERSRSSERISSRRLKMLERVTDEELEETVKAMKLAGTAGYQENILEVYDPVRTYETHNS